MLSLPCKLEGLFGSSKLEWNGIRNDIWRNRNGTWFLKLSVCFNTGMKSEPNFHCMVQLWNGINSVDLINCICITINFLFLIQQEIQFNLIIQDPFYNKFWQTSIVTYNTGRNCYARKINTNLPRTCGWTREGRCPRRCPVRCWAIKPARTTTQQ